MPGRAGRRGPIISRENDVLSRSAEQQFVRGLCKVDFTSCLNEAFCHLPAAIWTRHPAPSNLTDAAAVTGPRFFSLFHVNFPVTDWTFS